MTWGGCGKRTGSRGKAIEVCTHLQQRLASKSPWGTGDVEAPGGKPTSDDVNWCTAEIRDQDGGCEMRICNYDYMSRYMSRFGEKGGRSYMLLL